MSGEKITISTVLGWKLDSARFAGADAMNAGITLEAESLNADKAIQGSDPYFGEAGGNAARTMSTKLKNEAVTSGDVLDAIHKQIDTTAAALQSDIKSLQSAVDDVKDSEWNLFYDDETGDVKSYDSNWETIKKTWGNPASVAWKTAACLSLGASLKQAFWDVQATDKIGARDLATQLEHVSDAVKLVLAGIPEDAALRDILLKYQVDATKSEIVVWPDSTTLNLIRLYKPDMQPVEMTVEEKAAMDKLCNPAYGGNPMNYMKFNDIKDEAEEFGKNNKYTDVNPKSKDDGHGDAARHAYWNARMTQEFGADWAKQYATAHEGVGGNGPQREAMDLKNNDVGRQIGLANMNASKDDLKSAVIAAVDKGDTVVIHSPNGDNAPAQIAFSNTVPWTATTSPEQVDIPLPGKGK
ncbi:DUF6973 domain-containing protein [Nocardia sp. NPDC004340]|uniref:DUF6973 domain-containing protein n=1 Tax=Nocardia sp. CA-136227 TaxID=3239979 RepID=UPI003D991761